MLRWLWQQLTRPLTIRSGFLYGAGLFLRLGFFVAMWLASPIRGSRSALPQATGMQIRGVEEALETYAADHDGRVPTPEIGLRALVEKPAEDADWDGPYLPDCSEAPCDAWGTPLRYEIFVTRNGKRSARVWSLGPDRQPDTGDEIPPRRSP